MATKATKAPRELQPGDRIKLASDKVVTLTHVGAGMYTGSTLLEWTGNGRDYWGHVFTGDAIEVV